MKVLLVCGSSIFNKDILIKRINDDYKEIIAIDSGYNNANILGIKPSIIIGDMDSIKDYDTNIDIIKYNPIKDDTDLKLALDYCINKGYKNIDIICATGNRIDHMLNNISLLRYLDDNNIEGKIIDEYNIISVLHKDNHIKNISKYVSIIPITDSIIYSSNNLYYDAKELKVNNKNILSISNYATNEWFNITIHEGLAYLIQSD